MPRTWSPPEHNPLGLRPVKVSINARSGTFDPSLRAARSFLANGTLCSPPGLLVKSNIDDDDGTDFVTALIRPSQDDKV
jgi:hypothetical protein